MQIKLNERYNECKSKMSECVQEINDYNQLAVLIRSLAMVKANPEKWAGTYTPEDFKKVENTVISLCNKHEIHIPDYVEWDAIEII